ncbi:MAG TPA: hypothetical protein VIL53_02615 [Solirubrobacterales bacterium]
MSDLPDWANTLAIPAVTSAIVAYVVTLAKTQGEIKKLRHEQRTAHFSHRQGCYHDLLNAERRVRAVLWETGYNPEGGPKGWRSIKDEFRDAVNGVIIAGTEEAVAAARKLDAAYDEKDQDGAAAALREFVDAVRADVGPWKQGSGAPGD